MKRVLYILLLLVGFLGISRAENVEHEDVLRISFGGGWMQDQYLSPLLYKGLRVGLGNEWWQPFVRETGKWEEKRSHWAHVGRLDAQFDWLNNPSKSNRIYALDIRGGWGAYYDWHFASYGLHILLGPYLDIDWCSKLIGSNVNKPYSMDAAIDMMAMAGVSYSLGGKKTSYRLRYLARANMIGVDYIPDYWQSYYEMSQGVLGEVRCSGMWNHRTLRHELTLDMQFPHSTWRVGIQHEYNEYGRKEMMFSHEQVSVVVGTVFGYKLRPNKRLDE